MLMLYHHRQEYMDMTIAWPVNVSRYANFVSALLSVLRGHLVIGQFSFSLFFVGHHLGSTFTGTDRNGPNYRIGLDCAGRS